MSDDELEKLAAAMRDFKPSKAARERGMGVAMAAFDAEFAQETAPQTNATKEMSQSFQGSSLDARPTVKTTRKKPVETLWSGTMANLDRLLKPKSMAMLGSCMAALIAAMVYLPNIDTSKPEPVITVIEEHVSTVPTDETLTPSIATEETEPLTSITSETVDEAVEPQTVKPEGKLEPIAKSIDEASRERPTDIVKNLPSRDEVKARDVSELETSSPKTLKTEISESVAPASGTPSNIITIERRIIKNPASVAERVVPAATKTETRRVLKTPASTVERTVPAVTKDIERRIDKGDGSFETVTETIVVNPQSVTYETIPPVYETVTETVVVQEASTELVTIPAVYETVTETIQVNADGSTTVLSSTASAPPADTAPKTSGGVTSVSDIRMIKSEVDPSAAVAEFESRSYTSSAVTSDGLTSSPPPAPIASAPTVSAPAEIHDEIIVTSSRKRVGGLSKIFAPIGEVFKKDKSSAPDIASSRAATRSVADAAPEPVADALSVPFAADEAAGTRIVERRIPAVTKTIARRVIKTPASTMERVIPAITKEVTVQVAAEDGTLKDVTTTIIIQEASTELVTVPATYETVADTIVVAPEYVEYIIVDSDGNVLGKRSAIKPKPAPKPEPQAGQLTAGDYDDVLNPDLYKIYLDKMLQGQLRGKDLPYVDADQRINIRVNDKFGNPVPLADITLKTGSGKTMFPLRTGADGMAYLYPNFDSLESGDRLTVSIDGARDVRKTLSRKLVRNGGDLTVNLDVTSVPIDSLDLLLTIDATGSMGDEMRYLQTELKSIVGRVKAANPGIDIRTGLIVYRDVGDQYVTREIPFTDDIEDFRKSLSEQSAGGGGDTPEAMHTALKKGLEMDWREDALKVNLLVADAPPHDRHITDTWDAGLISRTRGIHMVPLAASGVDKTAEFLMRSMAQVTGGRFLFLTDDSGIGNPHAEPTIDCYIVTRLDGLVTRTLSSLIKGERVEPEAGEVIRSVGNYRSGKCIFNDPEQNDTSQNASFEDK